MFRMEHPLSVFRVEHFAYTGVNKHQAWWDPCLHQCKRRAEQGGVYTGVNISQRIVVCTPV